MDEFEFRRILELFPIVRPRDYCLDVESSGQSTSRSKGNKKVTKLLDGDGKDQYSPLQSHDSFWDKLKSAAEKKFFLLLKAFLNHVDCDTNCDDCEQRKQFLEFLFLFRLLLINHKYNFIGQDNVHKCMCLELGLS
ncbi:uncharacterized protein [Coffea arabica]|uniref:Uncharacterized protein isoform X1 n=1 Tax=Coffea arabica TaxID=13443 RepID=A0ABM4WCB3_COFAR